MGRKGESVTLALDAADKKALEAIASDLGCIWGEKASVSELMRQIARGYLKVSRVAIDSKSATRLVEVEKALESALQAVRLAKRSLE